MTLLPILLLFALVVTASLGATIPTTAVDESTCRDLCSSCDGEAKFEEGCCECSIDANNGTECLGRMKRQANEYGLDVVSCDVENEETRSTRCTLGHKNLYGKSDMDRVAKYFMSDGPMTGSIFIAPPLTHKAKQAAESIGKSADCGSTQGIITQPAETMVSAPLIVQPQEFMPMEPVKVAAPAAKIATTAPRLNTLGFQEIAPQFISMLGEVLTKPILGLPQAIQTVSEVPGISDLVAAPANLLNSLADQMAGRSKMAKENLDNFREVVGKAKDDVMLGLSNYKDNQKTILAAKPPIVSAPKPSSSSGYSMINPHPMISWLNPTVGAPAPTQFVGAPIQTQFVSSALPTQYFSVPQLVSTAPVQSQMVGAPAPATSSSNGQMVGSPLSQLFGAPTLAQLISAALQPTQLLSTAAQLMQLVGAPVPSQSQMVGAPSPSSSDCGGGQIVGSPQMMSNMPVIQSLGTIPLSSIVGQVSPTYLVSSPMTYYSPAVQTTNTLDDNVGEANLVQSLEEIPLSSPPQKKICKKSTRSMKYTRDVKALENEKEEMIMTTTTTTTEVPMIERTTTQKPKTSVIGKIKPKKIKVFEEKL